MPDYKCSKCGSEFKKKWNYEYHMNRKIPCVGINTELTDNTNLVEKENNNNTKNPTQDSFNQIIQKIENGFLNEYLTIEKKEVNNTDLPINNLTTTQNDNELICKFCKKSYSSTSNLNKHLKGCKVKINKEREEQIEKQRKEENEKLKLINSQKDNIKLIDEKRNIPSKPITIHISKSDASSQNILKNTPIQSNQTSIYKEETYEDNKNMTSIYKHTIGIEINKKMENKEINKQKENEKNESNETNENVNDIKEDIKNTILKEEYESEFIKEIKKELFELKNIIKNNQLNANNNSVNNHYTFLTQINQNFFINNFGKECIDTIKTDFYFNLLSSPYESVPKLVEEIHFNKDDLNNTNIILPNQNLPFIYLYENGKWIIANKESTLNLLVDKNFERVDDFYEHYKNYLEKTIIEKYEKYSNEFEETNLKDDIQKDVSNVLEKGSQQIIETIIEKRKRLSIHENNEKSEKEFKIIDNIPNLNDLNTNFNPNFNSNLNLNNNLYFLGNSKEILNKTDSLLMRTNEILNQLNSHKIKNDNDSKLYLSSEGINPLKKSSDYSFENHINEIKIEDYEK